MFDELPEISPSVSRKSSIVLKILALYFRKVFDVIDS